MATRSILRTLCLAGLGLLVACGGGSAAPATGILRVSLTDGPFGDDQCLFAAWISFDHVEARSAGEWIEIPLVDPDSEGNVTLDLLALRNGLDASLALGQVPVGALDEIRLHITGTDLEFTDKSPMKSFKVPSGMSSGLKLKIDPPILVAPGQTTGLIFDVDAASSFHATGAGGDPTCDELKSGEAGAVFSPVVRILNEDTRGIVTGLVTDEVATPLEGAEVSAYAAGDALTLITSTFAASASDPLLDAGQYALLLEPGEYDLHVGTTGRDPVLVATVDVGVGAIDELDLVLPAAP